jgi:hypothetical protein
MKHIDQSTNLGNAPRIDPLEARAKLVERRQIERDRQRRKRLNPVYVAKERAANAARMREHRERLRRCRDRRRHAIAEERAP